MKSTEVKYPFTAVVAAGIEMFGVVPPVEIIGAVAVTNETDPPALARTCGAAPSQYIILFVVVLYQARPLSAGVSTKAVSCAAVNWLNPKDLFAAMIILPELVILNPPIFNEPAIVSPARFTGVNVNAVVTSPTVKAPAFVTRPLESTSTFV